MDGLAIRRKDLDVKPGRKGASACVPVAQIPPGNSAALDFDVDFMIAYS